MARSQESFNKKEREKKRRKKQQEKRERREQRKAEKEESGAKSFEDMLSYVDENGNLVSEPPDPSKKKEIKAEDIVLGAGARNAAGNETKRSGKVKFFNEEKGYGFILDAQDKSSVFVHISNLTAPIKQDDRVTFEIEMGPKGATAVNVELV